MSAAHGPGGTAPQRATELEAITARLRTAGSVFAEEEAQLLVETLREPDRLEESVRRREAGEPLETVLGWVRFGGLTLGVVPGVFVPRRRTELLVRLALERCRDGGILVDLCTGVGAVPCAVLEAHRYLDGLSLEVFAADIDPVAVDCARQNLRGTGAVILCGDLDALLPREIAGSVSVMTANAPYVPSGELALLPREARDFEPPLALDGGPDGVALHRRIADLAPRWLAPGGSLLIETGAHQAGLTAEAMARAGLTPTVVHDDELAATVVVGVLS